MIFSALFRARQLANGERSQSKPVIRFSSARSLPAAGGGEEGEESSGCSASSSSSSLLSTAEDSPAAAGGRNAESALGRGPTGKADGADVGGGIGWAESDGGRTRSAESAIRSAESAVCARSAATPDSLLLHKSIRSHVEGVGGEMGRCIFYKVEEIAEFTTTNLKQAVCGVLNTHQPWLIFLGVSSTGKVKGCKMTKRQV